MNVINSTRDTFESQFNDSTQLYGYHEQALTFIDLFDEAYLIYINNPNEETYESLAAIYQSTIENLQEIYNESGSEYIQNIINEIVEKFNGVPLPGEPVELPPVEPEPPIEPPPVEPGDESKDWWDVIIDWFNSQDDTVKTALVIGIIVVFVLILRRLF